MVSLSNHEIQVWFLTVLIVVLNGMSDLWLMKPTSPTNFWTYGAFRLEEQIRFFWMFGAVRGIQRRLGDRIREEFFNVDGWTDHCKRIICWLFCSTILRFDIENLLKMLKLSQKMWIIFCVPVLVEIEQKKSYSPRRSEDWKMGSDQINFLGLR